LGRSNAVHIFGSEASIAAYCNYFDHRQTMTIEKHTQRLFAASNLPALTALTAVNMLNAGILIGILLHPVWEWDFQGTLRIVQSAFFLIASLLGCFSAVTAIRLRRAPRLRTDREGTWDQIWVTLRWSLYLGIALLAANWALWNYEMDGVLTWPDTEDYAMIASQTWYSPTFWTGGNPPGLPLVFKVFGLNWDTFTGHQYANIANRITIFQSVFSFFAVSILAFSVASVMRRKWLRPLAVFVVFGLGLSIEVAQWNRMLLSESLSTSLLFGIVAGGVLLSNWWFDSGRTQGFIAMVLAGIIALGIALYTFTRDVNSYFLFALGVLSLPLAVLAAVRRKKRWWAYAVIVGVMLLAAVGSASSRQARWSYPFINLVYDRILPDSNAVDFFVRHDFPIEVIESIQPKSRNDLHVALRAEQAEPFWSWFEESARLVHIKFLLSRPVYTLIAPLSDLPELLSPEISWYRVRIHSQPAWLSLASAFFYPKSFLVLGIWLIPILGSTAVLIRSSRGQVFWAIPLLLLVSLYPLFLVIWHGDTAAMERHSQPVGLGLRLSLWLLTFFVLDEFLTRSDTHSSLVLASVKPGSSKKDQQH
jgi:hypothetical protein